MDFDDEDNSEDLSPISFLVKNGSAKQSESVELHRSPSGQCGSMEHLGVPSEKKARRSHSLGNLMAAQSESIGNSDDEGFLIGRRELSVCNLRLRSHSHIRITEVAPSNSALFSAEAVKDTAWKVPVQMFTDKKRGKKKEDKHLSKRMRSYYKAQDDMINAFETIQSEAFDASTFEHDAKLQKRAERLAQLSFLVNLMLLIAKAVAVGLSSSIAIISSLVDSAVDLLSGIIIWWTSRAMKKKNIYTYPEGRSRLEPTGIIVLSVVMALASFQLIINSIQKIIEFTSREGSIPTVELSVILISVGTVVLKCILYLLCRYLARLSSSVQALAQDHRNDVLTNIVAIICGYFVSKFVLFLLCHCFGRYSSSVRTLALDHRNDVLSNIVAIICGYLGSQQFMDKVGEYNIVYIDPVGAIIISIYILANWWKTGHDQMKLLTGHTADPNFLSKITWICLNHHEEIAMIDTVRAFHFGNNFLVEVDIVLPEDMSLKDSHNIGETLQQKLEKFPLVERAFVHLDYETEHHPSEEHKPI